MANNGSTHHAIFGLPPLPPDVQAACHQTYQALRQLIHTDPDNWPAHLAGLVGVAADADEEDLGTVLFELGEVHDRAMISARKTAGQTAACGGT